MLSTVRRAEAFGIRAGDVSFDWTAVQARKNRLTAELRGHKGESLEARGITWLDAKVRFTGPDALEVDGGGVSFERAVLCSGSKALVPPVPGIEQAFTSDAALELEELPRSLVIVGGGFIAMEFAHIFHAFDVEVTVVEMADRVLTHHDGEIAETLQNAMREKGIALHLKSRVRAIEGEPPNLRVHAGTPGGDAVIEAEAVMNATGRGPNVDGLAVEEAEIEVSRRGVVVNEDLQTTNEQVYAAGDVVNRYQLTPVASHEAKVAAENALRTEPIEPDYRVVPSAVFSDPEIGSVGLTEEEAEERGIPYRASRYDFKDLGAALLHGEAEGFAKLLYHEETGEILGGHIIGPEASELVLEVAFAMQGRLDQATFGGTMLIHPTLSETLGSLTTTAKTGHMEGCCG